MSVVPPSGASKVAHPLGVEFCSLAQEMVDGLSCSDGQEGEILREEGRESPYIRFQYNTKYNRC